MIKLDINTGDSGKQIARLLKGLPGDSKSILKTALNRTARDALKALKAQTKKTYDVKASAFKTRGSRITIYNAKKSNLSATIFISSKKLELIDFKVSPKNPQPTPPKFFKGKVLKKNSLKPLGKYGNKAFLVRYPTGHITIAARKTNKKDPIATLHSPAITQLIGSYKVYGFLKPKINKMLGDELKKQAQKVLAKRNA